MYKTTTYWKEYIINLKNHEIEQLEKQLDFNSVSDWLIYHRKLENISQDKLAKRVGIEYGSYIKDIEINRKFPNRDTSMKLAKYFKIGTKYFYDSYLEETEQIHSLLLEYRKKNNLGIKYAAKLIDVSPGTWSNWEKQKYEINRENYSKLKNLNII
ncbi:MAG: helix-turn-helix domain-containing protein [Clostridium sp.]|uniref:helix-turn-helix domain-containing protein n=1 Tax=Clostridium sp. TaxID=1506 RepID=UPI0025C133E1|nr:helix-turn-helix transcriptional regulator [Clostridium sp.]MCE5220890.1 helix-turn-helix domain-containing protein [Clostridium sp.]